LHREVFGRDAIRGAPGYELRVSAYDRAASLLISLLILVAIAVAGLLVVYLSGRVFLRQRSVPVTLAAGGRSQGSAPGVARDWEPPGVEELPDLVEPQLQETLQTVADVASSDKALLDNFALHGERKVGEGSGRGDLRAVGEGAGTIPERVPRAERWEIRFEAATLESYAEQLEALGIELGLIGQDGQIDYFYNLTKDPPDRRRGPSHAEKRLYMTWRSGPLERADRELVARAGVDPGNRLAVQFYSSSLESMLAAAEIEHARPRDVNQIRRTVFAVRRQGDAPAFYVLDQKYFR
jgi:hypothetical protein